MRANPYLFLGANGRKAILGIYIDRDSDLSITSQLCRQLRDRIQTGLLAEGTRLPPTRKAAQEYGIARNIVIDVYEQLTAEGYLIGKRGSGTYVASGITAMSSGNFTWMESLHEHNSILSDDIIDFTTGTPALEFFPSRIWGNYLKSAALNSPLSCLDYGDIQGHRELRLEITSYLLRTRGMHCHPDQIMIVSGSSEGFTLIAKAMYPQYHGIYLEEPTIEITQNIFKQMNYQITPIEVDHHGMKLHEMNHYKSHHLLLLTPAHQFPSGSILSIQRRLLALKLIEMNDTYLIEDDYDGDFRLKGVPIPPIHTLCPERVIYAGTFSKTLAPGLRIGFLVIPSELISTFTDIKESINIRTSAFQQIALAHFMRDGHMDRHIFKMKRLYKQRRVVLLDALIQYFGDEIKIHGDEAGMHLAVEFLDKSRTIDWEKSIEYGVKFGLVEEYSLEKQKHTHDIVLGYGNVREDHIKMGIERLHRFYEDQS
ncbi:PLP-dependent aminotransferase family protein [Marinicrinis lubricantis]|uniref:PLP-dependent aminotransferase family protein n=1 Tax=Marinicrinis lubricantis TaxID=2086470 RepID=A0ABW1ITI0_9BACL